jgi:hypothetical protein
MRLVTLTLALALLVVAGPASAGQPLYRTDRQAETYLEHGLKGWARIDLSRQAVKFASCFNGYYSKTEERTHRHFPQDRTNRAGAVAFRSFSCDFTTAGRTFSLYVVTTPAGWKVATDR